MSAPLSPRYAHDHNDRVPRSIHPPRRALSRPPSPDPNVHEILTHTALRLLNPGSIPPHLLWNLFSHACLQLNIAPPAPVFIPNPAAPADGQIIAVFCSPQDARVALSALSSDKFVLTPFHQSDISRASIHNSISFDLVEQPTGDVSRQIQSMIPHVFPPSPPFTISSNPPNPRSTFRAGDWMCSASSCCAHNFQRNMLCIACGRPRSGAVSPLPTESPAPSFSPRFAVRFHSSQNAPQTGPSSAPPTTSTHATSSALAAAQAQMPSKAPPPQYPPLTPSGRALSVGGRVRNISRDQLSPCIMYWPDNEPLPDPSQIRPIDSALINYPPIVNTGNKGAAEKQPGDWVCGKCNYHNWRRRKVCQTCYPYAEGNGDSISAAVQAERVALLTNVLRTQLSALDLNEIPSPRPPPTSAPAYASRFFEPLPVANHDVSPLLPPLGLSDHDLSESPIYQTSAHSRQRTPRTLVPYLSAASPNESQGLLPSFLQDIVHPFSQSPSPTSSSSADLSFDGSSEEVHYVLTPSTTVSSHGTLGSKHGGCGTAARKGSAPSLNGLGSIWKMDGEESKTLTTTTTPPSSSSSSSTRTSPTTAYAQASAAPRSGHAASFPSVGASSFDSVAAAKRGATSFWQAGYYA